MDIRSIQKLGTFVGAAALGLLISATVQAEARRPGLAGSLLIEDQDDLFFFPNQLTRYQDVISFGYGGSSGSGYGLLTLGNDEMAFGVAIHRGDAQSPHLINETVALSGPASLFGGVPGGSPLSIAPATIFDLLLGLDDLGFRLSIGSGADGTSSAMGDTGESDLFLMGEVGWGTGTRGESTRIDVSGALTVDLAGAQANDADLYSATAVGFSGLMRAFFPMEDTLDLGLLVNAGVASVSVSRETGPSPSRFDFGLGGGVGPALRLGPATVAGYGILRLGISNSDPDTGGDSTSGHTIVIPGVHMAVEVPLNDWLRVRSGAEYDFVVSGTSTGDVGSNSNTGSFGWNAGLGVVVDQFRFDGSLQHGFVTSGPNFIGGGTGFLAMASMTYSFDAARGNAVPVVEPEPVVEEPPAPEAPAPAPAPEPAPVAPVEGQTTTTGGWLQGGASGSVGTPTTAPAPAPAPAPVR